MEEESGRLVSSEFINIKSMTDNLSSIEILSEYYKRLGVDPTKVAYKQNSDESGSEASDDSLWSKRISDISKRVVSNASRTKSLVVTW